MCCYPASEGKNAKTTRKEVIMEIPQYDEDLLGLQKREYLAKHNLLKKLRKTFYFIFISQLFEA